MMRAAPIAHWVAMDEVRPEVGLVAGARSPKITSVMERASSPGTAVAGADQRRAQPPNMSEAHEVTGSQTESQQTQMLGNARPPPASLARSCRAVKR